jgi:general secretion pathway protein K
MRRCVSIERLVKDTRGFALILTLFVISLILTLTLQLNTDMRAELDEAANLSDGVKLACIARSGFEGALAVLYEDDPSVDNLREDWANLRAISSFSSSIFDDGSFEVEIIKHDSGDDSGKIQINKLVQNNNYNSDQKALLKGFLESAEFGLDPSSVDDIIDAIKDWVDEDDEETGVGGAENSYYQTLETPYSCRNGPLESLEELLLVKGITPELFYGNKDEGTPGISNYLTVYGDDGKININIADPCGESEECPPPLILRAIAEYVLGTDDVVKDWIKDREDENNSLIGFGNYTDLSDAALAADQKERRDALLTTKSTYFEIISRGIKGTMTKQVSGTVRRDPGTNKLEILSWKIE